MRTRTMMAVLAAATFSLAGLGSASASNDSAHRPMKATSTSEFEFVGSCGQNAFVAEIVGAATMTHLGRVTFTGTDCVAFTAPDSG